MELLTIFRLLVCRRRLVALGAVLALACGALASGKVGPGRSKAPAQQSWQVTAEAQVDTPEPLVADAHASSATVQTQAVLFADYLTREGARDEIARKAGIRTDQLTVASPAIDVPGRQSALATAAQETIAPVTPYTVAVTTWAFSPLITLVASGPDERVVLRLSDSAMEALKAGPGTGGVAASSQIVVRQLGPARAAATTATDLGPLLGVAASVFAFGAWCVALVLASGLLRLWRGSGTAGSPAAAR